MNSRDLVNFRRINSLDDFCDLDGPSQERFLDLLSGPRKEYSIADEFWHGVRRFVESDSVEKLTVYSAKSGIWICLKYIGGCYLH
jgi:hypothetical protein